MTALPATGPVRAGLLDAMGREELVVPCTSGLGSSQADCHAPRTAAGGQPSSISFSRTATITASILE